MAGSKNRETSRLEGLSDAVFAFAATLLVVSLEVPNDFAALIIQMKGFVAFAITFGALLAIWTVHRAFFSRYDLTDGWTIMLNCTLLFVVLFYVFPLKFLTESFFSHLPGYGGHTIYLTSVAELGQVFVLYSTGFAALFLVVALMYFNAWRLRERLELSAWEAWEAGFLSRHYLMFSLAGLLSIGVALTGYGVWFGLPGFVYLLLGPVCYFQSKWSEGFRPK
jgi:uncharacterized membrane protein